MKEMANSKVYKSFNQLWLFVPIKHVIPCLTPNVPCLKFQIRTYVSLLVQNCRFMGCIQDCIYCQNQISISTRFCLQYTLSEKLIINTFPTNYSVTVVTRAKDLFSTFLPPCTSAQFDMDCIGKDTYLLHQHH